MIQQPVEKHAPKVRSALAEHYKHLGGSFAGVVGGAKDGEAPERDAGLEEATFYPYVDIDF